MTEKKDIVKEVQNLQECICPLRKRKKDLLEEILKIEYQIDCFEEQKRIRMNKIWKIEQEEFEKASEMSWEDMTGNSRRKEIKNMLQEEIKVMKKERKYMNADYNLELSYEKISEELELKWKKNKRAENLKKEIDSLTEKIEENFEKIEKLYD